MSIAGCGGLSSGPEKKASSLSEIPALGQVVSVAFGPDGRLWRLVPTQKFVFVDYSTDYGKTFSKPIAVNQAPLRIRARSEDRPSIAIDDNGWIYVLFLADGAVPWSAHFSLSKNGGTHFSDPILVSDQAHQVKHYQTIVAVNGSRGAYVFWSDERGRDQTRTKGNALYYAPIESSGSLKLTNAKITESICECCRLAVDFDVHQNPVVFSRMIYDGSIRDHGIVRRLSDNSWLPQRTTYDEWKMEGCPEHGPALSISEAGRYHMTWFTQGAQRKGIFYAHSDDRVTTMSKPMSLGDSNQLPGHADVLALGDKVVLVWQEFDGVKTVLKVIQSKNRGEHWSTARIIANSDDRADYPFLISDGKQIFVSWYTENSGYYLLPVNL